MVDPGGYWVRNVRLVTALLLVWFAASYGLGILLAGPLNAVRLPGSGFRLGFWFAQQGSIYVFLALIWVYARRMNRLDREFGVREDDDEGEGGGGGGGEGEAAAGADQPEKQPPR